MKQTIGFFEFRDAFKNFDRLDNFPNGGLSVLWDFLESYEEDTGEELELDVIALCCDFYQSTFDEVAQDYSIEVDYTDALSDEDRACLLADAVISYLQDNTMIVGTVGDNQVIYQAF